MQHIENIKNKIEEQGWQVNRAFKLGPFYKLEIEKDSEVKEVNVAISSDEEMEEFNNG